MRHVPRRDTYRQVLVAKLEQELETLNASMASEEVYTNPDRLRDTQYRIVEVEANLESSNEEWLNWETA